MIYNIIEKLMNFWHAQGCVRLLPYEYYVGAGTFHPQSFFGVLGDNCSFVYPQRCLRKGDGRYGESPNRLINHHQLEVIIQPAPVNIKDLYLESLNHIGIDIEKNDIKFVENNWESLSLGATGVGWEVLCNTMEVCQFTYFQRVADLELNNIAVELSYGLERNCLFINSQNLYDMKWDKSMGWKELYLESEKQLSIFYLENIPIINDFDKINQQIIQLCQKGLYIPAYNSLLEMNDIFNSLDAIKKISELNRINFINIMRKCANRIGQTFLNLNK